MTHTDESLLGADALPFADKILNCPGSPAIDPQPHEHIVAGLVLASGHWMLADIRTFKPWWGHA